MKQLTINAFTFDELSDKAKEKARNWWREDMDIDQWSEQPIEDASQVGIKIERFDIGRAQVCDIEFEHTVQATVDAILENHGEMCDTYKAAARYQEAIKQVARKVENGDHNQEEQDDAIAQAEAELKSALEDAYLAMLTESHDYEMSDEGVDENILANDYLFTEDGSRTAVLNEKP